MLCAGSGASMATTPALHFPAGMGKRNKINAVCVPEETDGQLEDPISHAQVPPPSATCPADWRLFKKILQESLAASRYRRSAVLDTYKSNDLTRALHYEQSLLHMASHVLYMEAEHQLTPPEHEALAYRLRNLTPSCLRETQSRLRDLCSLD